MIRARLLATATFLDHLLLQADSLISACLDIRPLHRSLAEAAEWFSQTWRDHLAAARTRLHGPGRGLTSITIHDRPTEGTTRD